jgi:hypothetical protein
LEFSEGLPYISGLESLPERCCVMNSFCKDD